MSTPAVPLPSVPSSVRLLRQHKKTRVRVCPFHTGQHLHRCPSHYTLCLRDGTYEGETVRRRVVGGGGGSHVERRGLPVSPELVCCLVIICFVPVSFMSQNTIMIHRNNLCEAWQRIPRFIWLFVDAGGSMAWAIPTACHNTTTLGKLLSNL